MEWGSAVRSVLGEERHTQAGEISATTKGSLYLGISFKSCLSYLSCLFITATLWGFSCFLNLL